jgi:DNA-binding beta-propeller fold protein YncE
VCVAAVLGDATGRVGALGGRVGMPRSLGSVLGGMVTRFLGGSFRGAKSGVIHTYGVQSDINGTAVTRDGATLLVSDGIFDGTHSVTKFSVADDERADDIGGWGEGPLGFFEPRQVWVASDDYVFVADACNRRVQVLTPRFDFHGFVGVGQLSDAVGVCASADVVVVSENKSAQRISVFNRGDGTLRCRFGSKGSHDGQLKCPLGLCFMSNDRHVAVAEYRNRRVSVFSVGGTFVRHIGVGVLKRPQGVACSAFNELVVADSGLRRVVLFNASGVVAMTMGRGEFNSVVVHGSAIVARDSDSDKCIVFT